MGVALMTGDFMLGATGTVTAVDGDRLYGFGHPMYNLGPTQFPLTRAEVHVVLPSLLASSKIASFGEIVGTVQQDRATAVAGRLGSGPAMIPMSITLNSDRTPSRTFNFTVVKDVTFTPLLTYLTVANVLTSYERGAGPASYTIKGTATIRSHGDIAFEDIFAGDQPAGAASAYVAGPITFLLKNASEPVDVEKLTLTIDATEQSRTARIERVWLDTDRPRAGREAIVKVLLRTYKGEELIKSVPIQIPANATGSLQLLVADANRLTAEDRRAVARRGSPAGRAADSDVQQGAPQQSPVHPALRSRRRRGRERRSARFPAAVRARRARIRSQQRHLQRAAQRDTRRMGSAHRARRERLATAHPDARPAVTGRARDSSTTTCKSGARQHPSSFCAGR